LNESCPRNHLKLTQPVAISGGRFCHAGDECQEPGQVACHTGFQRTVLGDEDHRIYERSHDIGGRIAGSVIIQGFIEAGEPIRVDCCHGGVEEGKGRICFSQLNYRVENSHQPFRRRARAMAKFRSAKSLEKFVSIQSSVHNHFNQECHLRNRQIFKLNRSTALAERRKIAA
jgi:hypothetical protein